MGLLIQFLARYGTRAWRLAVDNDPDSPVTDEILNELQEALKLFAVEQREQIHKALKECK